MEGLKHETVWGHQVQIQKITLGYRVTYQIKQLNK
jgi:hypothetical protein